MTSSLDGDWGARHDPAPPASTAVRPTLFPTQGVKGGDIEAEMERGPPTLKGEVLTVGESGCGLWEGGNTCSRGPGADREWIEGVMPPL